MNILRNKLSSKTIRAALVFLILPVMASAQLSPLPTDIIELDTFTPFELSEEIQITADDYLELLNQLQDVIHDYHRYFSRNDDSYALFYKHSLLKMLVNLEDGTYCGDVKQTLADLKEMNRRLKIDQDKIRTSGGDKRLYKNLKGLQREFVFIHDLIEEDVAVQLIKHDNELDAMKKYLCQIKIEERKEDFAIEEIQLLVEEIKKTAELRALENIQLKELYTIEQAEAIAEAVEMGKQLQEFYALRITLDENNLAAKVYVVPSLDSLRKPPIAPQVPSERIYYHKRDHSFIDASGRHGITRKFSDSIDVISNRLPIFVNSKIGRVDINGWNKDKLVVTYKIDVLAKSSKIAAEFVDDVELKLESNPHGIYISTNLPSLNDPDHQIQNSHLIIMAPNRNNLICENSFGKTNIEKMQNGVSLNTNNSDVYLKDIHGPIKSLSNKGSVQIIDVVGRIDLKSSLGRIDLNDCQSDFDIQNKYSLVRVNGCNGDGIIRNTGNTSISFHTGDVMINSDNGRVDANYMNGAVEIINAYQPVFLNNITGSASVHNQYAQISVTEMEGQLKAFNNFGLITISKINGPFDLTNSSDDIYISLDKPSLKASTIKSDYGKVSLLIDQSSDLNLNVATEGGMIKSGFTSEIKKKSGVSSLYMRVGKGTTPLEIQGINTTIILEKK